MDTLDNTVLYSKYVVKYFTLVTQALDGGEEDANELGLLMARNIVTRNFGDFNEKGKFGIWQEMFIIYLTHTRSDSLKYVEVLSELRLGRYAVVIIFPDERLMVPLSKYYKHCAITDDFNADNIIHFEKSLKSIQIIKWNYLFPDKSIALEFGLPDIKRISRSNPF